MFKFIDLFAGCGGLSLGLLNSGWDGVFAIEKNTDAFRTFAYNLISGNPDTPKNIKENGFRLWPEWLPCKALEIDAFLKCYQHHVDSLVGQVDLLVGGPPCQGYSFAGKRNHEDPRNRLLYDYIKFVDIIKPKIVLVENVKGINVPFRGQKKSHGEHLKEQLECLGYHVHQDIIESWKFGIPQLRPRYITVGFLKTHFIGINTEPLNDNIPNFFELLNKNRLSFLNEKNLPDKPITVLDAIGDIAECNKVQICNDIDSPRGRFREIIYSPPHNFYFSEYQEIMRVKEAGYQPNSLRLTNHKPEVIERLNFIIDKCRKGARLSLPDRKIAEGYGIKISKKQTLIPLDANKPSPTITTNPDDLIHYKYPRTHTVREYARFQSFPDWFAFLGKFTTGGNRRQYECPRYTQVGNAVPPLLAEAIGVVLKQILSTNN